MKNGIAFLALSAAVLTLGCSEKAATTPEPSPGSGDFPMVVSDNWVPSGYMGDADGIVITPGGCPARSSAAAKGDCYKVVYTPGTQAWGGVFWLYPANNWGTISAGKAVPAGATKLTFQARAEKDGQPISFQAGGVNESGNGGAYMDSFKVKTDASLSTAWQPFNLDLAGHAYTNVIGGFEFSLAADPAAPATIVFYLDDIKWDK